MYFSNHLFYTVALTGASLISVLMGSLAAQFIDVDHTGGTRLKLSCAIHNSSEACPKNTMYRGWLHTPQALILSILAALFGVGFAIGHIIHFKLDGLL